MSQANDFEIELGLECKLSLLLVVTIIWTVKESLSKILKTGLTIDFHILSIKTLTKKGNMYEGTFINYCQYKFNTLIFENYICTIVMPLKTNVNLNFFYESFVEVTENIK